MVAKFHKWSYHPRPGPGLKMDALLHTSQWWLQPDWHTASQVIDKAVMDWFLQALLPEEHKVIAMP